MKPILSLIITVLLMSPCGADQGSYAKKAAAELDRLAHQIDTLRDRSQKAGETTRKEIDEQTKVLQEKLQQARDKVKALENSSSDTWEPMKDSVNEAVGDLQRMYRKAKAKLQ